MAPLIAMYPSPYLPLWPPDPFPHTQRPKLPMGSPCFFDLRTPRCLSSLASPTPWKDHRWSSAGSPWPSPRKPRRSSSRAAPSSLDPSSQLVYQHDKFWKATRIWTPSLKKVATVNHKQTKDKNGGATSGFGFQVFILFFVSFWHAQMFESPSSALHREPYSSHGGRLIWRRGMRSSNQTAIYESSSNHHSAKIVQVRLSE